MRKGENVSEASGERSSIRVVRNAAGRAADATMEAGPSRRGPSPRDSATTRRAAQPKDTAAIGPRAVDRAAAILLSFSFSQPSLSLAQLAQAARLPKPSAYRIVSSLVA